MMTAETRGQYHEDCDIIYRDSHPPRQEDSQHRTMLYDITIFDTVVCATLKVNTISTSSI
jgi:hypothetical protein